MNVQTRAAATARIFDLLAKVVLGVGILVSLLLLGVAVLAASSGAGIVFVIAGIVGMLLAAAGTVLGWAGITLATVVSGYIAAES